MKLRKLNYILHRDLGYLFFGMCIIYALSGLALNHLRDWNPNYVINKYDVTLNEKISRDSITKDWIVSFLEDLDLNKEYKKHYFPSNSTLKVFLMHGNVEVNLETGKGTLETIHKRPVFNQLNFLHYNPGVAWKWFSDIFCIAFSAGFTVGAVGAEIKITVQTRTKINKRVPPRVKWNFGFLQISTITPFWR